MKTILVLVRAPNRKPWNGYILVQDSYPVDSQPMEVNINTDLYDECLAAHIYSNTSIGIKLK